MKAPLAGAEGMACELFAAYTNQDWEAVRAHFDATMEAQLPEAQLRAGWQQLLDMAGAFREAGQSRTSSLGDVTVVDVPLTFERSLLIGRVAYNGDGQVAGLFILTPEAAGWSSS
jgi:hypothetical protein